MLLKKISGSLTQPKKKLSGPFRHEGGFNWLVMTAKAKGGDTVENRFTSTLCLYEDGRPMMAPHQPHDCIRLAGQGRYSHWGREIWFSTSDGSDPNVNGREYSYDFSL